MHLSIPAFLYPHFYTRISIPVFLYLKLIATREFSKALRGPSILISGRFDIKYLLGMMAPIKIFRMNHEQEFPAFYLENISRLSHLTECVSHSAFLLYPLDDIYQPSMHIHACLAFKVVD